MALQNHTIDGGIASVKRLHADSKLIILMRILPMFPILSKFSQNIEKFVNKVIEEERNQRQDLFVLATSYIGQLKSRAIDMKQEADFQQMYDKTEENAQLTSMTNANGTGKHFVGEWIMAVANGIILK